MKGNSRYQTTLRANVIRTAVAIISVICVLWLINGYSEKYLTEYSHHDAPIELRNTFSRPISVLKQQEVHPSQKVDATIRTTEHDTQDGTTLIGDVTMNSIDVDRGNNHPIRIAYIFAGSARSFKCPKVHWSLRFNVIDAFGGEPYVFVRISEEDNQNVKTGNGIVWKPKYGNVEVNETLKILNPRKVQYFSLSTQQEEMKKHFPQMIHRVFRENDQRRYSMFYHRCMGYRLALEYEREHGIRFDWVALIRLDAAWLDPVLPIQYYANDRVWLTETGYVAFNDQFMLIPRQFSDYLYDLNTKVTKEVYCLGGPDVETWKCDANELASRKKYSAAEINETLTYCCADVSKGNYLGYSETIHYRHLLNGKIPVSMARFTVFITRYTGKGLCYADCPRLHYHYKDYATEVLTRKYPYWKTENFLDSSHVAITTTDGGRCAYLNHESSPWKPLSASELHKQIEAGNAKKIDYSQNLYSQWDTLHPSLRHNPADFLQWRIHPSGNANGCLTADFTTYGLSWSNCQTHFSLKSGRRIDPQQAFHLIVIPHRSGLLRHPLLREEDKIIDFEAMSRSAQSQYNVTQIRIFQRTDHFDLRDSSLCLTVGSAASKQFDLHLKPCHSRITNINQLFYAVKGVTGGVHPASTLGLLRPVAWPEFCLQRDENVGSGWNPTVASNRLSLAQCSGNKNAESQGRMYFEFELISPN